MRALCRRPSLQELREPTQTEEEGRASLRLLYVAPDGEEVLLNNSAKCELHGALRGNGPPP